jgi:flagellar hook-length control protein FliK
MALNETHTVRQRLGSDPQTVKVVDLTAVKVATSTLQMEASGNTSMVGSESLSRSDSNQGESDASYDSPDTTQNMSGQLVAEQQKMSAVTTKPVPVEPLRQDIPAQVMPQVKERLDQHDIKLGKQQITLTLSPDSLGEIKMNLNLQGEKLSIEIVTENRSVRDAIVQHADVLKESLARQNITIESFDITTGGKGSGNQGQNQNAWRELMKQQQEQQQQQQQFWTSSRGYNVAQADPPSELAIQQRRQGQSMLDVHY